MIDTDKYEGHEEGHQAWQELVKDAPKLLAEVKRLTKTLELIAKEMPFDYWLHTLINDVIGYEKWQAKEMIE